MIKYILFMITMTIIPLLIGTGIDSFFILSSSDHDILLGLTGMSSGLVMGIMSCWFLMAKPKYKSCDKCDGKGVIELD